MMVAANMSVWIVDSHIGGPPDRALGSGPSHEKTLPWAWDRPGPWPFRGLGSLGPGPAHEETTSARLKVRKLGKLERFLSFLRFKSWTTAKTEGLSKLSKFQKFHNFGNCQIL